MKKLICLFSVILFIAFLTSCSLDQAKPFETDGFGMGTVISQKLYGRNARRAADEVWGKIHYLEGLMAINAAGGDVNRLNEHAGQGYIALCPETVTVLQSAIKIAGLSGGAFDITVGPVVKCWNIGADSPAIPAEAELKQLITLLGYQDVHIDADRNCAALARAGQMVDLGGIAKGYAGDAVREIYQKQGIRSALVNLGGNVVALGKRPDGKPWSIGIQNPRAANGKYIGIVQAADQAVVTAGDYQRYFEKNGKRYHHIIDPRTGRPAASGLMSVTVVAGSSTDADALSTAAFVLGLDQGMQLIKRYGQAEAIFITTDNKIYVTEGLQGLFTFKDETGEFTYVENR